AFQDRVYAVTPRGHIVELPIGATPQDFAYHINTQMGQRCPGAKVNGRIVPLNTELRTGDQVEVLTAKQGTPGRDWLNPHLGYLKSSRARAKVRQWFKLQDQDKNLAAGRTALDREFQRLDLAVKDVDMEKIAGLFNFTRPEELYIAIGHGELTPGQVVGKAQELLFPASREAFVPVSKKTRVDEGGGEITIRGVGKLLTQIAPCCQPVPFDDISGFITRGRGVTIHRRDCPNLLNLMEHSPERIIEVDWGQDAVSSYSVDIALEAYDRAGLLRDITSLLANERINVLAVNTLSNTEEGTARMYLTLEIQDLEQLSRLLDKLGQLPNIIEVRRRGKH
ncbi:MAG: ACT domain-containing protein, partial [Candidatus Competibacteraceae bacterium]|nr:ACT domain-containing protein [Candidatus Competibacteraceae bacterium]